MGMIQLVFKMNKIIKDILNLIEKCFKAYLYFSEILNPEYGSPVISINKSPI